MKDNTPDAPLQITVTAAQASSIIPVLEGELVEVAVKQTEAKGELNKIEREFLKQQKTFQKEHERQKKVTDYLTGVLKEKQKLLAIILKHVGGTKEVHRLMRGGTHGNGRQLGKGGIQWGKEFINTLKREQRFMTFEELLHDYEKRNNTKVEQKKTYTQPNNFKQSDIRLRQQLAEGKQIYPKAIPILIHDGHYGLIEWFDQYKDGKILPKAPFMKQFMYAKTG